MKPLLTLVAASAVYLTTLTGCATVPADQMQALVQAVQAYTKTYCSFEPTLAAVTTIVSQAAGTLFPAGVPIAQAANAVGAAICASPPNATLRRGGTATVTRIVTLPNGVQVPVQGRQGFVRQ